MEMRSRLLASIAAMATSLAVGVAAVDADDQGASATPARTRSAVLAAVRAVDPRFAALPDFRDAQDRAAAEFDFAPTLAGSWIKVLPTFGESNDPVGSPEVPRWMDPGDRVVEVMLVAGCPASLTAWSPTDPCGWRHTWLYLVRPTGDTILLADAGSAEAPQATAPA